MDSRLTMTDSHGGQSIGHSVSVSVSNALFAQDYGQLRLSNAFTVYVKLCMSKLDWNFLEFGRVVQYPLCQKKIVFYTALEQCFLACTMRVSYRAPRGHLAYSKCTIPATIAQCTRPRARARDKLGMLESGQADSMVTWR